MRVRCHRRSSEHRERDDEPVAQAGNRKAGDRDACRGQMAGAAWFTSDH